MGEESAVWGVILVGHFGIVQALQGGGWWVVGVGGRIGGGAKEKECVVFLLLTFCSFGFGEAEVEYEGAMVGVHRMRRLISVA